MAKRGFIVFFFALLLTGCVNFEEPEFVGVNSVAIKELTLMQVTTAMNVRVHNPNQHSITIESTEVDVIIKDTKAGKLTIDSPIVIQAQADADCDFVAIIKTKEAVRAGILSVDDLFTKGIKVRLTGVVDGRYGMFRKKLKVDTTVEQKPRK
jgi:LEA14-like dessication related protein